MLNVHAALPTDIANALPGQEAVLGQAISVDGARWRRILSERDLIQVTGKMADSDRTTVTRQDVFNLGDQSISVDHAFQLLYYSLAWGLGLRASRLHQRLDNLAAHQDRAGELLVSAWESVRAGAPVKEAYSVLTTDRGAGQIPWLGPAFSTKFLYFAQGNVAQPRHLILDKVVATNLTEDVWPAAPTKAWWPETYELYCGLLNRWAVEISEDPKVNRTVRADEIEFAIFKRHLTVA